MMDNEYVESNDIANKYLRGELTAEELEDFEVYLMDKAELLEELELDMLLQQHLPLVQFDNKQVSSKWLSWPAQPLVASFATLVVCAFSFILYLQIEDGAFKASGKVNLVYISPLRSSSQEQQATLSIAKGDEQITLVLQPSLIGTESFNIKMFDPKGLQVIEFKLVGIQGMGDLVISVPGKLLKPGLWTFELSPTNESEQLERLILKITY